MYDTDGTTVIPDQCFCYKCGGTLCNWRVGDDPEEQHLKIYPDCSQVRDVIRNKIRHNSQANSAHVVLYMRPFHLRIQKGRGHGGIWIISPLINLKEKRKMIKIKALSKLDPLWQNFLDPRIHSLSFNLICFKRVSFGRKYCTKELKPDCT